MSDRRDYYEVLGVERSVDAAELKRAYRKLAMELHPDRNPGDAVSESKFKEASEAYQVLSDPEKRARYDRFGHAGPSSGFGGGFHDVHDIFSAFGDIFGDIFGGRMGGGGRASRGSDIEVRVTMSLQEAFTGVTKDVKVLRRAPCGKCGGTGAAAGTKPETCQHCGGRGQVMHSQGFLMISTTCPVCRGEGRVVRKPCGNCDGTGLDHEEDTLQVSIPAGVEDGSTLRMVGRGEKAPQGGPPGNLYVILRVQGDDRFERDGADLHAEIAVSFPQLALGDTINVPTLDGEGKIDVPAGTQPGETLALRGRGMPRIDGRGRGDIVAHLKLVVPPSLSPDEEAHLRAYAAAGGQRVSPERSGGFFKRKKKK
ncbi:MAG TPA: molecular chaperone DnaJ [Polyangia bacterium]|nr:molecular chaperone DnaJ [Polyangia bacterium]